MLAKLCESSPSILTSSQQSLPNAVASVSRNVLKNKSNHFARATSACFGSIDTRPHSDPPSGGLLLPHPAATEVAPVSIGHNAAVRSDVPRSATRKHLRLQCYGFVRIPTMMGFYRRLFVRIHKCSSPAKANNAVGWKVPTIWGTLSERTHSVFTRDDLSNCADVHVHVAIACTCRVFQFQMETWTEACCE